MTFPIVITSAGVQPTDPSVIRQAIETAVAATNPGYTANLPGSLIEDILSTEVGGIAAIDSARVDLINSLTPYGANEFLLNQLGQIYGVQQGIGSNTSVYVVFTGSPGYVIAAGFTVSDGSHQYVVQDGGIIESGGMSAGLFCLATTAGSWAVPIDTVTTLITSVPSSVTLSVTNPTAGLPGATAQTEEDYRAQVIQAGLAEAQGMPTFLKTQLQNVSGVQARLVSVRQPTSGAWEIIVGGGDPYAVANAIFTGIFDISTLVGSMLLVTGITNANPGVATTNLNHGYSTGQVINISGVVGMSGVNNTPLTITVISETTFSIGVNTTSSGAYVSGGIVTPNLRNVAVSINDYPDTYVIPFVNPPQQTVGITLTWNTTSPNFVSPVAIAQLGSPALMNYINSIAVGQPINLFELQNVFQTAIASIIPPQLLSRMIFAVTINSVSVSPTSGTGLIVGDPESYFETTAANIVINQG